MVRQMKQPGARRAINLKQLQTVKIHKELKKRDRITIVGQIHHEHIGEENVTVPIRHTTWSKTTHQPFAKRLTVSKGKPLPLTQDCWIPPQDIGRVVIENKAGSGALVVLSPEEQKEQDKMVLYIREKGAKSGWEVPPGDFFCGTVENAADMEVISGHGEIPYIARLFGK